MLLFAVAAYVVYEAIQRLQGTPRGRHHPDDRGRHRSACVINLICFRLLQAGAKESLNLRGAYLEVIADAVGSVGVLIGAVDHRR